ncbi:pentapeptide repeat-containing protein [Synechococcus sp. PCC 7336]|uniref:pentapeptide repeat-containing protein n=1 Tax=Synechococcus sp. PCC 7336 TaxID=195250 RepID=UPI0003460B0F|nr:pentapeptide repeat-containing protein [Synechococcus sp. PCC 7336]
MDSPTDRNQLLAQYKAGQRDFSRIALSQVDLSHIDVSEADFSGSDLTHANFTAAILNNVSLRGACLDRALLDEASLPEADLQGAELACTQLEGADLAGANLSRTNASGANLAASSLCGANLGQVSLVEANLTDADLARANLEQANLAQANLSGANLVGVKLDQSCLEGALYSEATRFPEHFDPVAAGMQPIDQRSELADRAIEQYRLGQRDFNRIDLSRAQLRGVDLSEADLSGADLTKTNLTSANLSQVLFRGASLNDAILTEANLTRADLRGAELENAQLANANLAGVNLARAELSAANLAGAQLQRANLEQACLAGADFAGADLSDANLAQTNLNRVNFERANLCGADLQGTNLILARLAGAIYSPDTRFPLLFEPSVRGMQVSGDRRLSETIPVEANGSQSVQARSQSSRSQHTAALAPTLNGGSAHLLAKVNPSNISRREHQTVSIPIAEPVPSMLNLAFSIDTSTLMALLAGESWEEASTETVKLLLACCRQERSKLDERAIATIPEEAIQTIDRLWSKMSRGKFGFAAQLAVLDELRARNPFDGFETLCNLFLARVRWKLVSYRTSYVAKVERGDGWVKGQFPVYFKHFVTKKSFGFAYAIDYEALNRFWARLKHCLSETEP